MPGIYQTQKNYGYTGVQSKTYWTGNGLGYRSESYIAQLLDEHDESDLKGDGSVSNPYKQRFEKLDYSVRDSYMLWGEQGRFEITLFSSGANYNVNIIVYFNLIRQTGLTLTNDEIIRKANEAITDYWGAPDGLYPRNTFALVSQIDGLTVNIIPQIKTTLGDGFHFDVKVFPDSITSYPGVYQEVVNMDDFEWNMREQATFSGWYTHSINTGSNEGGRGPHEFGHMMGIPHDISDPDTIMSTIGTDPSKYQPWKYFSDINSSYFKNRNIPYTAHFKLVKIWVERVFASKYNRLEDFIIVSPYELT